MLKTLVAIFRACFSPLMLSPNLPGLTLADELKSAVAVALTGTLVETVLATYNLPAGLLGANGEIEIELDATETNNANAKTLAVRLGGLAGTVIMSLNSNTINGRSLIGRCRLRNNAAVQRTRFYTATDVAALTSAAGVASAVNLQADTQLVVTGTLANIADTLQLEAFRMRFWKAC
jgi:hypothetical protein